MRINDTMFALVDRNGDIFTMRTDPFDKDTIPSYEAQAGKSLAQTVIRLSPELYPSDEVGQVVLDAVVGMDLIGLDEETMDDVVLHGANGGTPEDRPGVCFVWSPNAAEQIGQTIKDTLRGMSVNWSTAE